MSSRGVESEVLYAIIVVFYFCFFLEDDGADHAAAVAACGRGLYGVASGGASGLEHIGAACGLLQKTAQGNRRGVSDLDITKTVSFGEEDIHCPAEFSSTEECSDHDISRAGDLHACGGEFE